MPTFLKAAKMSDVPPGHGKTMTVGGREIAIFNVGGTIYAIDDACRHRGGSLGEGELDGDVITCPLHAWTYDVKTGECFDDPDCPVSRYNVKVEGDDVLVEV